MRDWALERDYYARHVLALNVRQGRPADAGLRCPVCRVEYRCATQYSTPGRSPLGREMYVVTCSSHYCRSRAPSLAFWPVDQTRFGSPGGNCFSAVVAMLLELGIDDVPYFMGVDGWWAPFETWCRTQKFAAVWHDRRGELIHEPPPSGFSILSGASPRFAGRYHSVLAFDGRIVHDPHVGDRRGVVAPILDYITLEPIK